MANHDFTTVSLYAFLEPDPGPADEHPNPKSVEAGAGHIVYGLELDGVRVSLGRIKAGRYLRNAERHKQAQGEIL